MPPPSIPGLWKKVLVPTDFSSCSEAALKTAARLQQGTQAEVIVLHVVEPAYEGLRIHTENLHEKMRQEAEITLKKQVEAHFPDQTGVMIRVVEGRSAEMICATATAEYVDAIIIPTHGHSGLKHMLLGSVAEKVVRQAACDVLVVRQS